MRHQSFDLKNKEGWARFIMLCCREQSTTELEKFFDLFLTDEEKENLATRVLIIDALLNGDLPQREIAKQLKVSIAKITRGSNMLKRADQKLLKNLLGVLFHQRVD